MLGEMRRKEILEYIANSKTPVSGAALAKRFQVSRQVIVQDIALLRAKNWEILSTNRGYLMNHPKSVERIFWVCHNGDQIEEELNAVVDLGGAVLDVAVQHSGVRRAESAFEYSFQKTGTAVFGRYSKWQVKTPDQSHIRTSLS